MNIFTAKIISYMLFTMMIVTTSYAATNQSIAFYSSNNTQEIDVKKAYERLVGKPQAELKDNIINVLQVNHIEQGRFENILGTYKMADNNITGDNTKVFYASPLQVFSNTQIFSLAMQLANTQNQESVAVFVPVNQSSVSDVVVKFMDQKPSITQAINIVQEKLPAYMTAFSLHLSDKNARFKVAKVSEIEWLGSTIDINAIKKTFPNEKICSHQGQAYLVYKNGQVQSL